MKSVCEFNITENFVKSGLGRILIIDDDDALRSILRLRLEYFGYQVFTAANEQDAYSIFNENSAEIDMVVIDMNLPDSKGTECFYRLKTIDPEVKAIAVDYLIILGLSQTAMAVEIILEGAFSGAGNTIPPMAVLIPGSLARIPLAYFLAFELDWGINGIWWTLTITSFLKAMLLAIWFLRGKWKEKKL